MRGHVRPAVHSCNHRGAEAVIEDDAWLPSAPARAIRYLGEEEGMRYFNSTRNEPRCLIRITPRTVSTWTGGGWHPKYRS